MTRGLRVSPQAVRDIEDALAYTREQFGDRKFEQYEHLIREALADIAENPEGPRARRRPDIHADARTFHLGHRASRARHFLLYRIAADGHVDIGRLLHDSIEFKATPPGGLCGGGIMVG